VTGSDSASLKQGIWMMSFVIGKPHLADHIITHFAL